MRIVVVYRERKGVVTEKEHLSGQLPRGDLPGYTSPLLTRALHLL